MDNTRSQTPPDLTGISARSTAIFGHVVDAYVSTGEPVGSKTLSQRLGLNLSPATIRNVMAELEQRGLLYAPHTSAGRLPTEGGLRFFVHGLLEMQNLSSGIASEITEKCRLSGRSYEDVLGEVSSTLSGLSSCAGLVLAPKVEEPIRHVEFVALSSDKVLVVLVLENGVVENRVLELPATTTPAQLREAARFLNEQFSGRTIDQAELALREDMLSNRANLDAMTAHLVQAGVAVWGGDAPRQSLIVRGQANLLSHPDLSTDLAKVRQLFNALEAKQSLTELLTAIKSADGVQIFIGAESELFQVSGCSLIVAPFKNTADKVVGAIGVVGPSRLNYSQIIPMVDFTAKMVGKALGTV
ncbi:MAG: heat-inducible transcriptional repressor HrcA [Alphaproteobacteria bacterium]|jgi:heat-inducible transcriptional repressor|nr:heat-inducible transcriptional repressor HrcA [Thalassospira sp.]MCE2965747.1 heat-inducible transcriptional repressor HrcA [Alphaproteobacteria bacterium]